MKGGALVAELLRAWHRFGARTGGSVVMLGAAKMTIGITAGSSAAALLSAYPVSVLGVLLAFAGAELALPARDCGSRDGFFLAVLTACGCLGFNTAVGVAMGMAAAMLLALSGRGEDGKATDWAQGAQRRGPRRLQCASACP